MQKFICSLVLFQSISCASTKRNTSDVQAVDPTTPPTNYTAENCLDNQDMNAPDVDIKNCPALPRSPRDAYGYNLGVWEHGTTSLGHYYKYSALVTKDDDPNVRYLVYTEEGSSEQIYAPVDKVNLDCWAKGYYRLINYLKNPPKEYLALKKAGYQGRFFQFQTDLRYGNTGFKTISSYQNHLVKWVTLIKKDGTCVQPTWQNFVDYSTAELKKRQITFP